MDADLRVQHSEELFKQAAVHQWCLCRVTVFHTYLIAEAGL